MNLKGFELRRIRMPLVSPFRTSFGTQTARDVLLVRAVSDDSEGWGECVAMSEPLYSPEYVDAAAGVMTRFLIPALAAAGELDAGAVSTTLAPVKGTRVSSPTVKTAYSTKTPPARSALRPSELLTKLQVTGPARSSQSTDAR